MKKETINERLKSLRAAANKTQGEFASDIGISVSLYSKLEVGEKEVTNKVVEKVIKAYHVPGSWLRSGTGQMSFDPPIKSDGGFDPATDTLYRELKEQIIKKDVILDRLSVAFDRLTEIMHGSNRPTNFHKAINSPTLQKRRGLVAKAA